MSPDHGWFRRWYPYGACKFHPTCSMYAADAIQKYGLVQGVRLAAARTIRCHPWSLGGYDPVR